MDCKMANLLLSCVGARLSELSQNDRDALEAHCAQCDSCSLQLGYAQHEDQYLGDLLRDVPIPRELPSRLISHLKNERWRWYRTWPVRHARIATAAALLLVSLGIAGVTWILRPLPAIDLGTLVYDPVFQGMGLQQVENYYADQRCPMTAPPWFRYEFLVSCSMARLNGKLVPYLLFARGDQQLAEVYVLSSRDFDLPASFQLSERQNSGNVTVELHKHPTRAGVAYLIKYTGGGLDWLIAETRQVRAPVNAFAPGL